MANTASRIWSSGSDSHVTSALAGLGSVLPSVLLSVSSEFAFSSQILLYITTTILS